MDTWGQRELGVEVSVVDFKSFYKGFDLLRRRNAIVPFFGVTVLTSFCCDSSISIHPMKHLAG